MQQIKYSPIFFWLKMTSEVEIEIKEIYDDIEIKVNQFTGLVREFGEEGPVCIIVRYIYYIFKALKQVENARRSLEPDFNYLEQTIKENGESGTIPKLTHQNWLTVFYFNNYYIFFVQRYGNLKAKFDGLVQDFERKKISSEEPQVSEVQVDKKYMSEEQKFDYAKGVHEVCF
jgi:hypothetical protein